MAGQSSWEPRGSATKEFIVNPRLEKKVYYQSEYNTLFGRINQGREVEVVEIARGGNKFSIDAGNDSPVWEKDFNEGTGEARFTMVEEKSGLPTYSSADPKPGAFDQFKHSVCYVREVDSPAYPLVDQESEFNVSDVISDLVGLNKDGMARWRQKEIELDAFRAIFDGASRGLLLTSDGGRGITLPGASAGQNRSCYNTYVEGQTGLTTPNYTRATHEGTLSTLLAALTDNALNAFDYESHKRASYLIESKPLAFKPVKIGGSEYRAVAIIDPRNIDRLCAIGGNMATIMTYAYARGKDNPLVNRMNTFVLDDILYIPSKYIEYFRPTADGSTVSYLASTADPRSSGFSNTSNITQTVYMGAGALLRGRRKKVWFTTYTSPHDKGTEYVVHYHDGWMRNEWSTKDGRSTISNDSMLVCYNYDPGVGKAYNA